MTKNKWIVWCCVLLAVSVTLSVLGGCDLRNVVEVQTPRAVQQSEGLPSRMSLRDSQAEYEAWLADVQRTGAVWRENIEQGEAIRATLAQLALTGLNEVGPTLAGLPLGGPLMLAATGIVGAFVGGGRTSKEKEKSYNAGLEKGKELSASDA
ncbi:MAG: hypothetical protein IT442_16700 [Phycisphaeraceae bacterium]|nr:hypothetical protein [Phycisphaeraceae bacterium]